MPTPNKRSDTIQPEVISLFKKQRYLLSISEDAFRDEVIRPLFLRQGLKDGRDVCGPAEEGKDAIFTAPAPLGMKDIYVVQTKKGSLNLSSDVSQNVVKAATQLSTALKTQIIILATRDKRLPTKAFLCASGKINDRAKEYITQTVNEPNVHFIDRDDLIPLIDKHYPELWLEIDANAFPYFRNLRKSIEDSSDSSAISEILSLGKNISPESDAVFVSLFLNRPAFKIKKERGQTIRVPHFEEFPVTSIVNRKESLFLILGEAGSGKTTSLRRIAYELADASMSGRKTIVIPVILRARDMAQSPIQTLVDACLVATAILLQSSKTVFSNSDLLNGRVVALIDALDEIPSDDLRLEVLRRVNEFHALYPKCKVIMTSRDQSFIRDTDELKGFSIFWLSPFEIKQAKQLVERIQKGKSIPPEKKQELLRRLQDVHGMELNPLLVTVLVATSDFTRKDIPANITELFKKFTEVMLGRWDASKGMSEQFHAPLKDHILKKLAFDMHQRKATAISLSECKSFIENELTLIGQRLDINGLLSEIIYRSGLFRQIGDQIEFRHLLLQEFFAGRGISSADYLKSIITEEWWQRAIVFYFGDHPEDYRPLDENLLSLAGQPAKSMFQGSITLGLALQTCYLVPVLQRVNLLRRVIEILALSNGGLVPKTDDRDSYPLTFIIAYYLYARDSVSMDILKDKVAEVTAPWSDETIPDELKELRLYWVIVGLIESGPRYCRAFNQALPP